MSAGRDIDEQHIIEHHLLVHTYKPCVFLLRLFDAVNVNHYKAVGLGARIRALAIGEGGLKAEDRQFLLLHCSHVERLVHLLRVILNERCIGSLRKDATVLLCQFLVHLHIAAEAEQKSVLVVYDLVEFFCATSMRRFRY